MKKQQILIAEDDSNFGLMLKIYLEMNGFEVFLGDNGVAAWEIYQSKDIDLCILDVMMPHLDGFSLAEMVKKSQRNIPFVFLTAKALKEDQIRGYKLGALDYLIKPFDPEILLLKVKALLQGAKNSPKSQEGVYRLGNYMFDSALRVLSIDQHSEKLSPKEAALLQLLCETQGEILTHQEALLKIWHNDDYFTKQSMNVFITKLRKMLSHDPAHQIDIENLHSKGFMLKIIAK